MDPRESFTEEAEGTAALEVNPDNVCQLVQLARDFHAQDSVVVDGEAGSPDEEDEDPGFVALEPHEDDPIVSEFRSIIADLDRAQQVQVVSLMWLGRGDYDLREWSAALSDADKQWTESTADYLLAHPLVANHLEEALERFGHRCQ